MTNNNTFLYQQVLDSILDDIRAKRLLPGDKVPTEKELADKFSVSRITSRKALSELASAGVISRTPGRGSFISDNEPNPTHTENKIATIQKPRIIGLVIQNIADRYSCNLLRSIEAAANAANAVVIIRRTISEAGEEQAITSCLAAGAEGLIVYPAFGKHLGRQLLRLIVDKFPLTIIDRELSGLPVAFAGTDNYDAGRLLTSKISDNELRNLLVVAPPAVSNAPLERRISGIIEGLAIRGIPAAPETWHLDAQPDYSIPDHIPLNNDDANNLRRIITARKPSCIIALESMYAALSVKLLEEMGAGAPRDTTVYCFDDPGIVCSTRFRGYIRQNAELLAGHAVASLLEQIEGSFSHPSVLIPADYVAN